MISQLCYSRMLANYKLASLNCMAYNLCLDGIPIPILLNLHENHLLLLQTSLMNLILHHIVKINLWYLF